MVGLVIFTHVGLASAFSNVLASMGISMEQIASVEVATDIPIEQLRKQLSKAIGMVDKGLGVIVATDLFGGSPANLALVDMVPGEIEVVSGLNLAMLLKVIDLRNRKLEDPVVMARAVVREGRENIVLASDVLGDGEIEERTAGGSIGG